MTFLLVKR